MEQSTSINKFKKEDGYCYDISIHIEQISNGWLATKTINKYPDPEEREEKKMSEYPEENEHEYKTVKKYFKENPLDDSPIWDKVKF